MLSWNDLIGRRLGQYEIIEELGRGGSSRVYRAIAHQRGGDVAIKVIPNDAEDRVGFVQRFIREVEVIRKLHHPNIVQVYESGETEEIVYLVLQCVRGGTLRQRLGGRPLPVQLAALYVIQMARALHHAHLQGIIHRDVKPSNMLVDAENTNHLLLTDFGTAKIQGARGLTKSGTTIGTPEYMSPEQAEGREIDQRADIYALGCVLYEALATRTPFVGSTPVSVLYQQVHSRPASIRSYNTSAPRELARIIEITLAKRPEDRFGTAEALAEALTPFAEKDTQPTPAPWLQGATPSAPYSGPLAPLTAPRVARAPRTGPISGPATPPTLPTTGPLNPEPTQAPTLRPMIPAAAAATQTQPTLPLSPEQSASAAGAASPPSLPLWLATSATPPKGIAGAQPLTAMGAQSAPPIESATTGASTGGDDAPAARRMARQSIPLPAFRLPTRGTDPTGQTSVGLDRARIAELFEQNERATRRDSAPATPERGAERSSVVPPAYATMSDTDEHHRIELADRALIESIPVEELDTDTHAAHEMAAQHRADDRGDSEPELLRVSSGRLRVAEPPPVPRQQRQAVPAPTHRRAPLFGGVVAAVAVVGLLVWLMFTGSGLAFLHGGQPRAQATNTTPPQPTSTATLAPTPTLSPTPAGTATPTQQQVLDQEAFNSFRSVTLASFVDG
ncbi:MAG TPA: protein kinase, partial [Ktedonobacterales bacterium]|nr:protein kinase [Ktedonobacterales bacterium]